MSVRVSRERGGGVDLKIRREKKGKGKNQKEKKHSLQNHSFFSK